MYRARVHYKEKLGVDLPPIDGAMNRRVNHLWREVFLRKRRKEAELLEYIPATLFLMSGVSSQVKFKDRMEVYELFHEPMKAEIDETRYTVDHLRRKVMQDIANLKDKRQRIYRLLAMEEDENFMQKWINFEI